MTALKKIVLVLVALMLALFCACGAEKPVVDDAEEISLGEPESEAEKEESTPAEKVVVTIEGKDYEVFVPAKTRFEYYEGGHMEIITPSISGVPVIVDLYGLSGCEDITSLFVTLMSETEKLVLPELPNLSGCQIDGNNPGTPFIDAKGIEDCDNIYVNVVPSDMEIGKGPKTLELGYGIDLGMFAGSENVEAVMLHGETDLSKVADIGDVKEVYLIGEGTDLSGLEKLNLERLSLHYYTGDLSLAKDLTMETLVIENETAQEAVDTFTYSKTVYELHLNDETMTNLDILDKLPNLTVLLLIVDPIQPAEVPIRDEITDVSQIELLETNLPKEKLKEFFQKGGTIFIMDDWSRT